MCYMMDKHIQSTSFIGFNVVVLTAHSEQISDLSAQRDTVRQPEGSSVSLRLFTINADKQFNGLVKILMSKWKRQGHSCYCAALERITRCVPSVAHCSGAGSLL